MTCSAELQKLRAHADVVNALLVREVTLAAAHIDSRAARAARAAASANGGKSALDNDTMDNSDNDGDSDDDGCDNVSVASSGILGAEEAARAARRATLAALRQDLSRCEAQLRNKAEWAAVGRTNAMSLAAAHAHQRSTGLGYNLPVDELAGLDVQRNGTSAQAAHLMHHPAMHSERNHVQHDIDDWISLSLGLDDEPDLEPEDGLAAGKGGNGGGGGRGRSRDGGLGGAGGASQPRTAARPAGANAHRKCGRCGGAAPHRARRALAALARCR